MKDAERRSKSNSAQRSASKSKEEVIFSSDEESSAEGPAPTLTGKKVKKV